MRFLTEPALSQKTRSFASLRMTGKGLRMTTGERPGVTLSGAKSLAIGILPFDSAQGRLALLLQNDILIPVTLSGTKSLKIRDSSSLCSSE